MVSSSAILQAALVFALVVATANGARPQYGQTYSGVSTYYGVPSIVNCALPNNYLGLQTVAMNGPQYQGSCGMCLMVNAPGRGLGANPLKGQFMVAVTDSCFDPIDSFGVCGNGHLDFAKPGDGRWDISWKPVPCPNAAVKIRFEGSNQWYLKVQSRYMDSPMVSMTINGVTKTQLTNDHFFVFQSNADNGWSFPLSVEVKTVLGKKYTASISQGSFGNDKEFPTSGSSGGGGGGGGGKTGGGGGGENGGGGGSGGGKSAVKPKCSFPATTRRGGSTQITIKNRKRFTIRMWKKTRKGRIIKRFAIKQGKQTQVRETNGASYVATTTSGRCIRKFRVPKSKRSKRTFRIGQ